MRLARAPDARRLAVRRGFAATVATAALAGILGLGPTGAAAAAEDFVLRIKDHRFEPTEIVIPAGEKIKLIVRNQDPTPEEFESYDLNREKIVAGNGEIVVFIGPLEPGRYEFFGDFNADTALGWIVAE